MLKGDTYMIILVLLMLDDGIPKYIAVLLAFLGGMAIPIGRDISKKVLTWQKLLIRMLYIFGLGVGGWLFWDQQKIVDNFPAYIFIVTIFCEVIVPIVYNVGTAYFNKYGSKFQDSDKL